MQHNIWDADVTRLDGPFPGGGIPMYCIHQDHDCEIIIFQEKKYFLDLRSWCVAELAYYIKAEVLLARGLTGNHHPPALDFALFFYLMNYAWHNVDAFPPTLGRDFFSLLIRCFHTIESS